MSAHSRGSRPPEAVDRAELARLLPAPGNPDLPADRHRMLKERFMEQIEAASAAEPTGPAAPAARRRSRLRRLAWALGPMTAAVVAVVVVLSVAGTGPGADPNGPAAQLLGRIALVAEEQNVGPVRDDQFVYIDSTVAFASFEGNAAGGLEFRGLDTLHRRQIWLSVDGSRPGWLVEKAHGRDGMTLDPNPAPSLNDPTYRYLESLPTDPRTLLDRIYAETKGAGTSPDQEAFTTIGDLLRESLVPPRLGAALYRAAALIPDVRLIDDAVDAAGRHGVAVAHTDGSGQQDEWIFDRQALQFLGERQVMVRDTDGLKAGTILGTTAVSRRAVVDRINEAPESTD